MKRELVACSIVELGGFGPSWAAICWALSMVPPISRWAVMPVARKVWLQVLADCSAAIARRFTMCRALRRPSGLAVNQPALSVKAPSRHRNGGRRCRNPYQECVVGSSTTSLSAAAKAFNAWSAETRVTVQAPDD